jgi:hypothetical protein
MPVRFKDKAPAGIPPDDLTGTSTLGLQHLIGIEFTSNKSKLFVSQFPQLGSY